MATLVKNNGEMADVQPSEVCFTMNELRDLIGSFNLNFQRTEIGNVYVSDAYGLEREMPINQTATGMYFADLDGFPKQEQSLRGDVLICEEIEVENIKL
jgi:hypothetical protein